MLRISSLIHLSLFWAGVMSAIELVPEHQTVIVSVGDPATLRCSMKGEAISNYYINWYRKTQGNTMTFIYREKGIYGPGFKDNFQGDMDTEENQAVLKILAPSERDEGSYYCARDRNTRTEIKAHLGNTKSTDKLIFGKGTGVTVEPERQPHTNPSVFVMKNGTNVACLVKDFYPKDIRINLESSKKITEFDPAIVVSPSGKYNAIKLGQYGDSNSVTCSVQHNKELVYSTDFEVKTNSTDHPKPTETENTKQPSKSCHEPKAIVHAEKVNMMSLTVLGLRMLFAKSVAINFLLTAKLLFL
uniref:Ig-like domain-containing protein n=1 Tax=Chlorocebus sabaeus TaxID=60711 RepID=A0A0D9RUT1_CHLSB